MGVVFEAIEENLGRRVALKVLAIQLAEHPEFRARFAREATVLARSDSPHIIQVYSHGEQDGCLYLATQFVPGGDLAARVRQEGLPGPEAALDITAQVASALADAHAVGVVHRDVKPQNVLLRPGRGEVHAYLCDFGIARDDESSLTQSGLIAGTYAYLAPERFRGEPATPASDIYALGCLLWFLLTGRPPFEGGMVQLAEQHELAPVPQLPDAPDRLNAFLRRAMAKDPRARYGSAADAAAELRAIRTDRQHLTAPFVVLPTSGPPVPASPSPPGSVPTEAVLLPSSPAPLPEPPSGRRRSRTPLVAGAAVLALLGLGVAAAVAWDALRQDGGPDRSAADRGESPGGPEAGRGPYTRADVDGDDADDTILLDRAGGRTMVLLSARDGGGRLTPWAETAYGDARVVRGDFTGDGLADLAIVENDRLQIARSTGSGFAAAQDWGPADLPDELKVTAGDVDGDGRTDLMFLADAGPSQVDVSVALSAGSSFEATATWATVPGWTVADLKVGSGDVDGDDRADLVALGRPAEGGVDVQVLTSTDRGFREKEQWFAEPSWSWSGTRPMVGDYDGDGDADLLVMRDLGHAGFVVLSSDGTAMVAERPVELSESSYSDLAPVSADTDGDRTSDLVLLDRSAGEIRQLRYDGSRLVTSGRAEVDVDGQETIVVGITR